MNQIPPARLPAVSPTRGRHRRRQAHAFSTAAHSPDVSPDGRILCVPSESKALARAGVLNRLVTGLRRPVQQRWQP
ncbi:hypothetical protein [Kitasatospora sp. NPDC097691]|uniref:hypothetical protein n=1 Tax=Kitasatospora sp. NPDC097691 TaxID=3157231 RepID=UPI00332AD08C